MDPFTLVAGIASIIGGISAIVAGWQALQLRREFNREQNRKNKAVTIALSHGGQSLNLPVDFRRGDLTRAELLGRLGMIQMKKKGERFSLSYMNTSAFYQQLNRIAGGDGEATLTIPCTKEEFNQFDLKA